MADHMRTELVVDALQMAAWQRRPAAGGVHHSDHGALVEHLQSQGQAGVATTV